MTQEHSQRGNRDQEISVDTKIESPLLNREQAAAYLGISPKSVFSHTRRGLLPFVSLGGLIKYRKQSLDEVIAKLEPRSTVRK